MMEKVLDDYLEEIEKYLKPMSASERIDIVKEIRSEMLELQNNGKTAGEILERLGNPKELAKAYLGGAISQNTSFNWRKVSSVIAFYSLAGMVGMFVLPITSILAVTFMASGIIAPVGGIVKFIGYMLGFDIPQITFTVGSFSADAIMFLPISIVIGAGFLLAGKLLWNVTIRIIKGISSTRQKTIMID